MKNIVPLALKNNFSIVTRRENISLKILLNERGLIAFLLEVFSRICDSIKFQVDTYFLKNKTILFIHPQTAGFNLLNRLISRNRVYLYVMDNSFFCIRSYNVNPILNNECVRCLGAPDRLLSKCFPFPVGGSRKKMVDSLLRLKKYGSKVTFLAQNKMQSKLLKKHFGLDANCIIVGMDTNELINSTILGAHFTQYDLVFHGGANIAKGALWFLDVAELLPHLKFFMPCSKHEIEALLGRVTHANNITFKECSWESGLREVVTNAKLVCVPSLWSAPIEGALIKSIHWNGEVAVVRTQYGFSQEIPENVVLHLSPDPSIAALEISWHLSNGKKFKDSSHLWLESFRFKNSSSNIFLTLS